MSLADLKVVFKSISNDANKYFDEADKCVIEANNPHFRYGPYETNYYWDLLPEELTERGKDLIARLLPTCAQLAEKTRSSPLTGSEDTQDVKLATKAIRAALYFRKFSYSKIEILHDEGSFLGVQPAEQNEDQALSPVKAKSEFYHHLTTLTGILKLIEASPSPENNINSLVPESLKYIAGTAFIMMWMDANNPDLADVVDVVKNVFQNFGIRAVRADDIEHEGQITERILNEIKTAEFLFADLTGTRPNVYYETGFAHALGKRVILFRKSGTSIHFDLAGYNCPEYENLRDLKEKLTKRLIHITNKQPTVK